MNLYSQRSWIDNVKPKLDNLIDRYGNGSKNYNLHEKPLAVFDWDDTVIDGDIGMAMTFHQIDNLLFDFDRPGFWQLLPEKYGRNEARSAWESIKNFPLHKVKDRKEYHTYRKIFTDAVHKLWQDEGTFKLALWQAQLLSGFTADQIRQITTKLISSEFTRSHQEFSEKPIRICHEIHQLISRMQQHGFEVWIVSGTCKFVIESFSSLLGIESKKVIGVELVAEPTSGKLTTEPIEPIPYGIGKATAIESKIGKLPVFVAGNSEGDLEMMKLTTHLALLIDGGDAVARSVADENSWLIQQMKFLQKSKQINGNMEK